MKNTEGDNVSEQQMEGEQQSKIRPGLNHKPMDNRDISSGPRQVESWVNSLHENIIDVLRLIGSGKCKVNGDGFLPCESNIRQCLVDAERLLKMESVRSCLSISGERINSTNHPFLSSLKQLSVYVTNGIDFHDPKTDQVVRRGYQEGTVKRAQDILKIIY
jgi:hypothetical protein